MFAVIHDNPDRMRPKVSSPLFRSYSQEAMGTSIRRKSSGYSTAMQSKKMKVVDWMKMGIKRRETRLEMLSAGEPLCMAVCPNQPVPWEQGTKAR